MTVFFKNRTVVFGLTLFPGLLDSGSWYGFWFHGVGPKSNLKFIGYSHKLCATIALAYLEGRTPLLTQEFVVGLMFLLTFW